ncbi:BcpB protein [Chromatiales bacterium (ex Bugula neritina AB1)]|nr:BcpB protein [Chromatiales bacterium (ex Bugula neritina AB1)]
MNLNNLPENLPAPEDDGACDHLSGLTVVDTGFLATTGEEINLATLTGRTILYIYPMTAQPGTPLPEGWDEIPGARGCTPQSCSFKDHHNELQELRARVFGLSTQATEYQIEAQQRLHLPFPLLSDQSMLLKRKMRLPTFDASGMELYRRVTLVINNGSIEKTFYPVFPPDKNADEVIKWLRDNT